MLLGKRPRPPMRRTTSMTLLGSDWSIDNPIMECCPKEGQNPSEDGPYPNGMALESTTQGRSPSVNVQPIQAGVLRSGNRVASGGSSRATRRNGVVMTETAHFLQECCLCKRRLSHGRDIYMYRGDSAFCSVECRQQQIVIDERKEKCSVTAMKQESVSTSHRQKSGNKNLQTGTVAAG